MRCAFPPYPHCGGGHSAARPVSALGMYEGSVKAVLVPIELVCGRRVTHDSQRRIGEIGHQPCRPAYDLDHGTARPRVYPQCTIASSTALTVLTIPAVYVWLRDDRRGYGEGFTGSL